MAERQGFEPWVTLLPHTRSRRANSTTLAPLRTLSILADTATRIPEARYTASEQVRAMACIPQHSRHAYGCVVSVFSPIIGVMKKAEKHPVISLRGLTKRYGVGDAEHTVLNSIDLEIQKGEFIAIMGPSGCGKTTLLNTLGLLDKADEGDYLLDNKPVARLSSARRAAIRSTRIGFVFQNFNLIPRLNVIENVALPLAYTGMSQLKSLKKASAMLKNFHLNEREYYMPWQLSGGQTQRVAIARALVNDPSIILADEPTGNLDSRSSHIILEELSDIHQRGNTIIMVTHNPDMTTYADRVITMLDGRIDTDTKTKVVKSTRSLATKKVSLGSRKKKGKK